MRSTIFLCLAFLSRPCYPNLVSHAERRGPAVLFLGHTTFQKGIVMPVAVRIKAGKYGSAIGLLLERGGAFQTRHERTLIVGAAQKKVLQEAGLVDVNALKEAPAKRNGHKKNAGRQVPRPA